jgi:hypothetical protein
MPRFAVWCVTFAVALESAAPAFENQPNREYELKAAFVSSVMKFVEWPDSAWPTSPQPVVVSVLGTTSGTIVARALQGVTLKHLPVVVQVHARARDLQPSHVLFVTAEADDERAAALRAVEGRPVLTITEESGDVRSASVINLVIVDTKLTFHVNLDASERGGLRLGANLLSLARRVAGGRYGASRP